jgi:hypothetical protein
VNQDAIPVGCRARIHFFITSLNSGISLMGTSGVFFTTSKPVNLLSM